MSKPIPFDVLNAIATLDDPAGPDFRKEFARLYERHANTVAAYDTIIEAKDARIAEMEIADQPTLEAAVLTQLRDLGTELSKLTVDSVLVELKVWSHLGHADKDLPVKIWSAKMSDHFDGDTLALAEANFRAAWAQWNSPPPVAPQPIPAEEDIPPCECLAGTSGTESETL